MNKSLMSEEAFNELIDGFEYVGNLTDYGRKNIKYHVQKLQKENKQLKDNWNKLKAGLKFCYEYDYGVLTKDYLECVDDTLDKMQELEAIEFILKDNENLEQKNKELIQKIKFNEKSRRKMQQSLMKQIDTLEQQVKKQKEVIDKAVKYIDDLRDESAERQEFYNCFPDDLYIPDINELLDILKKVSR